MQKFYFLPLFLILHYCLATNVYYTYDRIDDSLHAWQNDYGQSAHPILVNYGIIYNLDTIGYSSQDSLPIFAVKLSDNANVDEDEARVLILGQCHAEEIYGVEIAMAIIECFINPNSCYQNEYIQEELENYLSYSLDNIELWIVPTHNPEGLKVVHGYVDLEGKEIKDPSYRKNIRDANSNNTFLENTDWKYGVGFDEDGVDLNRNYDVNWIFGNDYLAGEPSQCATEKNYNDYYDYYRGNEPFSENETLAIKNLVSNNQFLLSIAYHSSRSGCVAQRVVFPWGWKDGDNSDNQRKKSPDYSVIAYIGNKLHTILNFPTSGGAIPQGSRFGNAHDWMYRETGSIQFLIEVGDFDYQSDGLTDHSLLIDENFDETIDLNLTAFFYLLMIAAGGNASGIETINLGQITGIVTDEEGNTLEGAIVTILEMDGLVLKPRITDEYGRYRRLLHPDSSYTLVVSSPGYKTDTTAIESNELVIGINPPIDIGLESQPQYQLELNIETPSNATADALIIYEDSFTSGTLTQTSRTLPEDYYKIKVSAEGLSPVVINMYLNNDVEIDIQLSETNIIFNDTFSESTNWSIIDGDWDISSDTLKSQIDLFYNNNIEQKMISNTILVNEGSAYVLEIDLRYELEWEKDYFSLMYVSEQDTVVLLNLTGDKYIFYTEYIPLIIDEGQQNGKLLLTLETDHNLEYRGVDINTLILYQSGEYTSSNLSNSIMILPENITLEQNYPNPFNPSTNIKFSVPILSPISISIYNIRGELMEELINGIYAPGDYGVRFKAQNYSSGLYLYRLKSEDAHYTKKLMIIK